MARQKGTYRLGANLEVEASANLDGRLEVQTKADLLTMEYPYQGMIVFCHEDEKHYKLKGDHTLEASWLDIGGGVELTQAEYTALPEEEKMNGTTYFITDGGAYVPAVDIIPHAQQEPIIVGKFDLRGDGEYRNIYRIRRWISDLKNASPIITAGWTEEGVYIRPLRVYGSFTFHDYESTSTGFRAIIQQFPIPYSGYAPIEAPSGEKIGLKFYVDHNNKLNMVVDGRSYFNQDDFAQVIIDYIETPVS